MIGKTFGHYRIEEKLGQGGMGEVYRAADSKLGRDVALKLLPEAFARDPERLARFQREAQLLASLNHPHIAAIHGLENVSGIHALVLELVGGPTLSARIAEGPMPLGDALPIAHQIAQALEAAHEQGVIHRDLKPDNVKLTPDGRVKVLDFGLAKAFDPPGTPSGDLTHSPTMSPAITGAMTAANVILGTAGYMSPEQARGQIVDKRADIWAFGVVLFEMLTGRRLFTGETVSDTLAAVLRQDPDWKSLPDGTPLRIRSLLRRCLERDPKKRLRDIGDARLTLEEAMAGAPEEEAAKTLIVAAPADPRRRVMAGVAFAAITVAAFGAGWLTKPVTQDRRVRMFEIPVADLSTSLGQENTSPSLNPAGTRFAYVSEGGLWVRDLDRLDSRRMTGADGAVNPFWSPDGEWIGYGNDRQLMKVRADGGDPIALCELTDAFNPAGGGAWGPDGRIVFCHGDGPLLSVSEQGGDPDTVLVPDPETEDDFHNAYALPGGRGVLFVVHSKGPNFSRIDVLANGKRKQLVHHEGMDLSFPVYAPSGHLVYHRAPGNPGLWAAEFSLAKLAVTGEPFLAIPDVALGTVSDDGTLVYAQGGTTQRAQMAFCDRTGRVERTVGQAQDLQSFFALSPDGERIAVRTNGEDSDIWIIDATRETQTRFTFSESRESMPSWSKDGTLLYFQSQTGQPCTTFVKAADGTGDLDVVLASGGHGGPTPDGSRYVYALINDDGLFDLWWVPLGADGRPSGEPTEFLSTETINWNPRVSPDGSLVAYCSLESGRTQIYLKRFPSGEGKWQVTVDEGYWPNWRGDGRELFFATDDGVFSVSVELGNAPVLGTPTLLFQRPGKIGALPFGWPDVFNVSPDGQRFLIMLPAESERVERTPALVVVENWASTLGAAK